MSLAKLSCTKLNPNLIVSNVDASLRFYEDVLGFDRGMIFPEQSPFMFASVASGPVKIFLSDRSTVIKEDPRLSDLPFGGGNIMLIEVDGVDAVHESHRSLRWSCRSERSGSGCVSLQSKTLTGM